MLRIAGFGFYSSVGNEWIWNLEKHIQERNLIQKGEALLVAVSGGLDSMVLLHSLHLLAERNRWKLRVVHYNHRLRGRSSDADEALVRKTAKTLQLPISVGSGDVSGYSARKKVSLEMAARELRHAFFARTARKFGIGKMALGHHADDQVELFFLRLQRGSPALGGMTDRGVSPADSNLKLVRPLLEEPRERLERVAKEMNVRFREDKTNLDPDIQRNRIRQEVVPVLKQQQPPIFDTLLRSMDIVGEEANFVFEAALNWLAERKPPFHILHKAVQRRVVLLQLQALGVPVDFSLIEALRQKSGVAVSVGANLCVLREEDGTIRLPEVRKHRFLSGAAFLEIATAGSCQFSALQFRWEVQPFSAKREDLRPNIEYFDAAKVGKSVTLRHWRSGDRMQPIGFSHNVKLQDLFVNAKVPAGERRKKVVAVAEDGRIFWVEGLRISDHFKLHATTKRQLKWHWQTT